VLIIVLGSDDDKNKLIAAIADRLDYIGLKKQYKHFSEMNPFRELPLMIKNH
jgi:hypothetical protein